MKTKPMYLEHIMKADQITIMRLPRSKKVSVNDNVHYSNVANLGT